MNRITRLGILSAAAVALLGAHTVASAAGKDGGRKAAVARGKLLVTIGGCNDCHTPLKLGPNGPEPDMTRMLSGHPEQLVMPEPPALPAGPWQVIGAGTLTAWAGPWGVSFAANLTPDQETGTGKWTEAHFIEVVRSGRHEARGRPILPPMPIQNLQQMTDADLKAMFAYLQSIPAVKNRVPEAIPPAAQAAR